MNPAPPLNERSVCPGGGGAPGLFGDHPIEGLSALR